MGAPNGDTQFTLDPRAPIAPFVKWACEQARIVLWDRAAEHYCGRELEGGADPTSYKWLKSIRKEVIHPETGALECILTVAVLVSLRSSQCFPSVAARCPWRGAPRAYPLHVWWTCPHHRESSIPAVAKSQWMIRHATDPVAFPCLWLRGMLPTQMLIEDIPALKTSRHQT